MGVAPSPILGAYKKQDAMKTEPLIFAIDPGNTESAWVNYRAGRVERAAKTKNEDLIEWMRNTMMLDGVECPIEMIASYGMAVGRDVFETCLWIGRFMEAIKQRGGRTSLVYRKDVKLYLCGSPRAKDSNIRQALIDRYGPGREIAVGTKANPGPLYGVSADMWAALGVAVTHEGMQRGRQ